jgi:DNA-binding NarL/FixJ family response regulator
VIKVLLADDEAMMRAGVRAILDVAPDIEVIAEAGDGREAVEAARAGLIALDERVRLVGGTLDARSNNDGFTVSARLPLTRPQGPRR